MSRAADRMRAAEQHARKNLTWSGVQQRDGEWLLDFGQVPPRRYVYNAGASVYDTGMAFIDAFVHREPGRRNWLWTTYGLDFRLVSGNMQGIEFRTVEDEAVPKAHIKDDILFLDWTSMRAFAPRDMNREGASGIHIASPGAIPTSLADITVDCPDRKRIKELKLLNAEAINACVTTHNLHNVRTNMYGSRAARIVNVVNDLVEGRVADLTLLDADGMASIGAYLVPTATKSTFEKRVRIIKKHPYLKFTYKE